MSEGYRTHSLPPAPRGDWHLGDDSTDPFYATVPSAQAVQSNTSITFKGHFHLHTNCLELCSLNLEVTGSCSVLCFVAGGPEIFSGAVSLGWVSWFRGSGLNMSYLQSSISGVCSFLS